MLFGVTSSVVWELGVIKMFSFIIDPFSVFFSIELKLLTCWFEPLLLTLTLDKFLLNESILDGLSFVLPKLDKLTFLCVSVLSL